MREQRDVLVEMTDNEADLVQRLLSGCDDSDERTSRIAAKLEVRFVLRRKQAAARRKS